MLQKSMESILNYDPDFFENQETTKHNLDLVSSVGITFTGELHSLWFNNYMITLLRERAADLYRTKGVLAFHGQGNTKFVFQGVHEQINFGPASTPWTDGEEKINKFVFIGKVSEVKCFLAKIYQLCRSLSVFALSEFES